MSGFAMTAGSTPIFSAAMGSIEPTTFANMTTNTIERLTVTDTSTVTFALPSSNLSISSIFIKFTAARVTPHSSATRSSFHPTRSASRGSVSPRERLRMTAVEA